MKGTYHEKPFLKHFFDAIVLCDTAEALPHLAGSRHSSLARGSIMASIFSLEAVANILMTTIETQIPKCLHKLVDQGNILDKYEFVLFNAQPSKKFERGRNLVQAIKELIDVRNDYVHPRSRKHEVTQKKSDNGSIINKCDEKTNVLKLPASPEDWGVTDAFRVIKAASDFLDYFILDLYEMEDARIRRLLLNSVEINGTEKLIFLGDQQTTLRRACTRWNVNFRVARILLDEPTPNLPSVQKILFRYSCGKNGVQLHGKTNVFEVEGNRVTTDVVIDGMHQFFMWFADSESGPRKRKLLFFEVFSEDEKIRYASFHTYLTDWNESVDEASVSSHPMGRVNGVKRQLFFNSIIDHRKEGNKSVLTFLNESGKGREILFTAKAIDDFIELVRLNRRNDWLPEAISQAVSGKITIENKGSDYQVEEFEIVSYDHGSGTALCVFKAISGNRIQINMKPSTLMTAFALVYNSLVNNYLPKQKSD